MPGRLDGKVAIVTGAGSRGPGLGNGKACAILFAREGARVLCVDQVAERAEETVKLIRARAARPEPSPGLAPGSRGHGGLTLTTP
jgi:NAD(P)-dependent dehydrogenase (short-subunit alcohol dehydrogenase family)